jgi:hypothetical protein
MPATAVTFYETMGFFMPGKSLAVAGVFPVELSAFAVVITYFIQRLCLKQTAIDHSVLDRFRILNVFQWVFLQNN